MVAHLELDQTLTPSNNLIDFLVQQITPERILRIEADETDQERAELLVAKLQEGTLNPDELRELQQFRVDNRFVMALKARALELLNAS
jgi:hypothetical protein